MNTREKLKIDLSRMSEFEKDRIALASFKLIFGKHQPRNERNTMNGRIKCPECSKPLHPQGLAPHLRLAHGIMSGAKQLINTPPRPRGRPRKFAPAIDTPVNGDPVGNYTNLLSQAAEARDALQAERNRLAAEISKIDDILAGRVRDESPTAQPGQ